MRQRLQGLTLVELLVSLSIFSLLLVVLMSGYSQGVSMWERGKQSSNRWLSVANRHQMLRSLFLNTLTASYRGAAGKAYTHFFADQQGVEFMTRMPLLDLPGHPRPVRLTLERNGNDLVDVYYQEGGRFQDLGRGITWDAERRVDLLTDIRSPRLRYLAPAYPLPPELYIEMLSEQERLRYRDQPEWLDWYDSSLLLASPVLVELQFSDELGLSQTWTFRVPTERDAWSIEGLPDGA